MTWSALPSAWMEKLRQILISWVLFVTSSYCFEKMRNFINFPGLLEANTVFSASHPREIMHVTPDPLYPDSRHDASLALMQYSVRH